MTELEAAIEQIERLLEVFRCGSSYRGTNRVTDEAERFIRRHRRTHRATATHKETASA